MNRPSFETLFPSPRVIPSLDPDFRPAALAHRAFVNAVQSSANPATVGLAVEQADGSVESFTLSVFSEADSRFSANGFFLERLLKFYLWSRGGYRIHFSGPRALAETLQNYYATSKRGRFDAEIMGGRIYERPFEIRVTDRIPKTHSNTRPLGRHWNGNRIGFDLGGSDRKVAALMDGRTVFSEEFVWQPSTQSDPQWHFEKIMEILQTAAKHLPRVDGIGGSSAGVYVNNRVKVASLFRGVPADLFEKRVKDIFLEIKKAWGNVPFEVANDGDVTALAGSMSLGKNGVLGLAMGTSQAAGYVTSEGTITSWLNELAFAPIDYSAGGPEDEWSGDVGCGAQYLSQQAVGRLMPRAGIQTDANLSLPKKLEYLQELAEKNDPRSRLVYETIGTYLGYAVAHYSNFYSFEHLLVLGRVLTGIGGNMIITNAQKVFEEEFPSFARKIHFHLPDEKEKRHGQAMAAASLPEINS